MLRKCAVAVLTCGLLLLPLAAFTGAAQQQGGSGVKAFAGENERTLTRVFFFAQQQMSSPGQFSINYGAPEWKSDYDQSFDQMTKGKRIRCGKDFWTTLDTNVALTIGGKEVAPGSYYLVLERTSADKWNLILLDPAPIRAKKMDAFQSEQTTGGLSVPLTYGKASTPATKLSIKLSIKLSTNGSDPSKGKVEMTWGSHQLTADITAQLQAS